MDYKAVRKQAEKDYKKAVSQGRYPFLPALDEQIKIDEMAGEEYLGTMEIPVDMIVGTKTAGRKNSFSHTYLPLLEAGSEFATKWISLYKAQVTTGITDPIKCYEFMHRFYVEEGNKRVSVMKYLGSDSIMASVTRILPPRNGDPEVELYYEFVDFYKVTQNYRIQFSKPGRYRKLAEIFGQNLTEQWPEEAVDRLKNTFVYFGVMFGGKKGDEYLPVTAADAMLIYLSVYPLASLETDTPKETKVKLDKLWNEFRTGLKEEGINLVESPEVESQMKKSLSFSSALKHIGLSSSYSDKKPLKVAFIHEKDPKVSGWVWSHEEGRKALERDYIGIVETEAFMDCVNDDQVRDAIDRAVADGFEMIITTSVRHIEQTYRSAIHYEDVRFLNCSVHTTHQALKTCYARLYEAKFVTGAIAASLTENHLIGYRAYYPVYGAISNINAFAAGAKLIDPKCRVCLEWASEEGVDWRTAFAQQGIEFISGKSISAPLEKFKEQGLYQSVDGKPLSLAMPIADWGRYYRLIVRSVLDGTWDSVSDNLSDQALNYNYGMNAGVVDVVLSDELPESTRRMADYLKEGITRGLVYPFEGRLVDQSGNIRQESGKMDPMDIVKMDWLLDNIIGRIPKSGSLRADAREQAAINGVMG